MQTGLFFDLHSWLLAALLASARVMPTFILLPFLNSSVLSGTARLPIIIMISLTLWPVKIDPLIALSTLDYIEILAKELMIGLLLACAFNLPMWVLHAVGSIIDNQRGATLSSSINPLTGIDSSELASLFNLFAAVVVLEGGGLTLILEVLQHSFHLWPPLAMTLPAMTPALSFLATLMAKSLVLSSPAVSAFLLVEILLGLLSRYAPQMNAFSLALTLKSSVAFFVIILFFTPVIPHNLRQLAPVPDSLIDWLRS